MVEKIIKAIIAIYGIGLVIAILSLLESPAPTGIYAPAPDEPWN